MLVKVKGLIYSSHVGSAIITAIMIVYPLYIHEVDRGFVLCTFFAVATSTMIGFLANDIADIDRDRINKPFRPLVESFINTRQVIIAIAVLLIIFLLSVVYLLRQSYAAFFIVLYFGFYIIYNFINKISGLFKNLFIATGFVFPYLFVTTLLDAVVKNKLLLTATWFYFLYRELLMDVNDRAGDLATGLMTIPTRVSDSTARFFISLLWLVSVSLMFVHSISNIIICSIIIVCLGVQNLIWNNCSLTIKGMRILLISMWGPMFLSVFLIKT